MYHHKEREHPYPATTVREKMEVLKAYEFSNKPLLLKDFAQAIEILREHDNMDDCFEEIIDLLKAVMEEVNDG